MIRITLLMALMFFLTGATCSSADLDVPGDYPTLAAAISAASNGDLIRVADGNYTGPANRDLDLGGKAITIKSESGADNCFIDCGNAGRGFLFQSGEGRDTLIDGFTIINGNPGTPKGGGIFISDASPTIRGCVISDSVAGSYGGGIYCQNSDALIWECRIEYNIGGGVCLWGQGEPELRDCVIEHINGRGLECYYGAEPLIRGCEFNTNAISGVSAVFADPDIRYCSFDGNTGGGVVASGANIRITGCRFHGNWGSDGGAAQLFQSSFSIVNSTFASNQGTNGAAIYYMPAAIGNHDQAAGSFRDRLANEIINCCFYGNEADQFGGALYVAAPEAAPVVRLSTFASNAADDGGGAIYCPTFPAGGKLRLIDSILWGNQPDQINGPEAPNPNVSYSDVQGGWPGLNNFDEDPEFAAGPDGEYYLSRREAGQGVLSPCIDAGSGQSAEFCVDAGWGEVCMDQLTTRTDQVADDGLVDIGYHYTSSNAGTPTPLPTETPVATPTTNPTPTAGPFHGIRLILSQSLFHAGDEFFLNAETGNPAAETIPDVPTVVMLDINIGTYWFWPSWSQWPDQFDYRLLDLEPGEALWQIIPPFTWPPGAGAMQSLHFHAALLDSTLSHILGDMGHAQFAFE